LLNPLINNPLVEPIGVRSIDKVEGLAEKFRAALSRREPAIRDFFDIDYAVRKDGLRPEDPEFIDQVRQKLAIPGNDPVDVSGRRLEELRHYAYAKSAIEVKFSKVLIAQHRSQLRFHLPR